MQLEALTEKIHGWREMKGCHDEEKRVYIYIHVYHVLVYIILILIHIYIILIYIYMNMCMYVRMYICTYVRMYVCTYVRTYVCMYTMYSLILHLYMYISYLYTYIYTPIIRCTYKYTIYIYISGIHPQKLFQHWNHWNGCAQAAALLTSLHGRRDTENVLLGQLRTVVTSRRHSAAWIQLAETNLPCHGE